jgi:hypothetical protein
MSDWNRETPWRQGHLLDDDTVKALSLSSSESPDRTAVVVISHDCDLVQSSQKEPYVEVIVGHFLNEKANGNFTFAKNARKLHFDRSSGTQPLTVELVATDKRQINKQKLANAQPDPNFALSHRERSVLQQWLAARYRRAAFPDEFDNRLQNKTGLREKLRAILKSHGAHIDAIFFDVDDGEEIPHNGIDDPFKLVIELLYSTQTDEDAAREAAEETAKLIEEAFNEECFAKENGWQWIELVECRATADLVMTYLQSKMLREWRTDDISFRGESPN